MKVAVDRGLLINSNMSGSNNKNNFSNPKAPEHVPAPQFALPNHSSVSKMFGGMTPRSVTASMRAFSNVVMTPRADGRGMVGGEKNGPPQITKSNNNLKVMRGPQKSAPEKSIFDNIGGGNGDGEKYVDRAMQRRLAEKGQSTDVNFIPEPVNVKQETTEMLSAAQTETNNKSSNTSAIAKKRTVNLNEDIFPDAGEYSFETAVNTMQNTSPKTTPALMEIKDTKSDEMSKSIVASVEALIQESRGHIDDHEHSLPGMEKYADYDYDYDYEVDDDDVEDAAERDDSKKPSKRQKAMKEKQKIDRDLAKVTKLMKEKEVKR